MKAKSRLKGKRDVETPEKYIGDENQMNLLESENNMKVNESYSEFRITEESLKEFCTNPSQISKDNLNFSKVIVRYPVPLENLKSPTKRICVLKKAPANVLAFPNNSLLDQNNLKFNESGRPIQHSILGSVEEYFRMSIAKKKLTIDEIPSEFHHVIEQGTTGRPFSAMFPRNSSREDKENIFSTRKEFFLRKTSKINPDFDTNALRLWEQRMYERKQLQDHISKKVNRLKEKLVFNSAEGFAEKMKKSYLISKSIPFHDRGYGYRIGSEFWQQNEVVGLDSASGLHMSTTQTEKGYPPPILHVGVANKIKEEKGLPFLEKIKDQEEPDYYTKRYQQLSDVISELNPHQPDFADLMIMGNSVRNQVLDNDEKPNYVELQEVAKNEFLCNQNFSRPSTVQENDQTSILCIGPCLFINSMKLDGGNCESSSDSKIEIRILFNGYAKDKTVEKLYFKNRGTSVIRYWWKKIESYDPFNLENKNTRRFYFNIEDGILLPNQDLNFPIIFKSDKSGIFSETWSIETLPMLSEGKDIIVCMKGISLQRDLLATTRNNLDIYLKYQVAENICRNILAEIIEHIDLMVPQEIPDDIGGDQEIDKFNRNNSGIVFDIHCVNYFKNINEDLFAQEETVYDDWNMDLKILRRNIVTSKSIDSLNKAEMCETFYKQIDTIMVPNEKALVNQRDILYRICYKSMLDFFSQMVSCLAELRKFHDLPEMEMRVACDKKRNSSSRQKTSISQSSKKHASASVGKTKSKEHGSISRDHTDIFIIDSIETVKSESKNAADDKDSNENKSPHNGSNNEINSNKYHSKSYQVVYSLLDKALDNIISYWDDVTCSD